MKSNEVRAHEMIIDLYGVDVSDMVKWDYRLINRHGFFLAVTCAELAKRIIAGSDQRQAQAELIKGHLGGRYASDSGYLEGKASLMRALSTEIDVCRDVLRVAVQGLKSNEESGS